MNQAYNSIIEKLIKDEIISPSERDIYLYGLKSLLMISINFLTALLIGFLTNNILEIIAFLIFFIPLRSYAGGYHAKNKFYCYLSSNLILFFIIYAVNALETSNILLFTIPAYFISLVIIYKYAPLPNYNRIFDKEESTYFKTQVRKILYIELCLTVFLFIFHQDHWGIICMISSIIVSILLFLNLFRTEFIL